MDALIKVLTIVKLSFQIAFYGTLLGGLLYLLLNNPLPKLIEGIQAQVMRGFLPER